MKKNQRLKVLSLIFLFALFSSIGAYSQEQRVTVNLKNASLKKVFSVIEKQTTYRFSYRNAVVDKKNDINISERNVSVPTVLNQVLASRNLEYEIVSSKMIVISEKEIKAQPKEKAVPIISGIVKDDKGEPIIGASVLVKGTTKGTVTDINGHFELNDVPDNSTFIVSYVGYSTQQIPIQGKSSLKIQMTEDTKTVDEVVVVGYGTQKKVNLTGAVSAISNKEISDRKVVQTSLALQGIAPGVTITQRSGQPGLDAGNIRIRGIGTLNNSDPLILVDGVEMDMNTIDASSIESISILKDAASSSIYGSKAANGVILITTKRAVSGKFRFSLNSYLTKQSATDLPKKVNAIDHMTLLNEAKVNSGAGTVYSDEEIEKWKKEGPSNRDLYPDTDWQNEILKGGGIQQSHTFTLQGGTDQIKVFASLNYLNQDAIIKNVNYQRLSLRMNTDFIVSKTLTTTLDLYVYNQKRRSVASYNSVSSNGSGIGYVFYLMNKLPAVQAAKYSNGLYAEGQNGENPLAFINEGGFTKVVATPITATLSIKWNPIKDLNFKASISPNISYPNTKYFVNTVSTYNADGSSFSTLPAKSTLQMSSDYHKYLRGNLTGDYTKSFDKHNFKLLGGFEYQNLYESSFYGFRDNIFPGFTELQAGSVDNQQSDGWANEYVLLSYYGRLNYNYSDKYLFEANIRYDGSSKFASGNRWGAFPSFSAGWRMSEENFWKRFKKAIPYLKLRASWGTLGNQNIDSYYPFASNVELTTKYISNDQLVSGGSLTTMSNPDITWETTHMTNIGIDLNFIDKINVSFDWYHKITKDILMKLNIPLTMGINPTYQNAGKVRNNGWDLNISYADEIGDFKYNIAFNLSDVKNKILDLKGINGTGLVTNREGYAINSLYLRHSLGILQKSDFNDDGTYKWVPQNRPLSSGDLRYADLNNDNVVNDEDREVLGSTIPRYTYGTSIYCQYKGFDLNVLLQGVGKCDGYVQSINNPFFSGGTIFNVHKDRWTTENPNPNATFPRLYFSNGSDNNYKTSDFYIKDASYLRLKNFQIGYQIPSSITSKFGVDYLRIYFVGENIFTISNFWDGWDPEISPGSGGDYYPQVKNIGFGVDIKF